MGVEVMVTPARPQRMPPKDTMRALIAAAGSIALDLLYFMRRVMGFAESGE